MKKILLLLLIAGATRQAVAQCTVTAAASALQVTCGDPVTLSHAGSVAGNVSFSENFNNGSATGWAFTQQATFTNPCSPGGVDGTPHIWMGDQSGVPRSLETLPLNFGPSVAPAGGTICFDLLFAKQGLSSPCEGPDEPDEGVYLQYSVDNGATWITIHYFDPNGGNDPQLVNWNNWCFPIPAGALVNNVKFRWFQDADSGAQYDHWGIDNVQIIVNDPNVTFVWSHDNYTTNLPGQNPTPVHPTTTTTYTVTMITSSNGTCTDNITVVVVPPVFHIDLGNDTTICPGECVTLHATAYEVVKPASTPTFSNSQVSIVTGGTASMNINVQGLNTTTLTNGSITSVCINGFNFSGTQICTSFGGCNCNGTNIAFGASCNLNISSFNVKLTTPDGCSITLVPAGVATGTNYTNVCFVPAGGQNITGGGFPGAGSWNPSQPFSNLNGCSANGNWTMTLNAPGGLGFGVGSFSGWSISFDDPEITAPVTYTWSPTTGMTNANTLSPTICPSASTTYTLTVEDSDHCATQSESIAINIGGNCCDLAITGVPTVNPDCNANNGQITINYTGQTTGLQFSIDNGATYQSSNVFTGLAAGTYMIRIIDAANCPATQQVTLTNPNAPTVSSTKTNPTCGNNNGSVTITPVGGASPYNYSINGGTSQAAATFSNLAPGTYNLVVVDDNGCQGTGTATLANIAGPSITNVAQTAPSCGATDGGLVVTATGGTAPLNYSINGGATQTSSTFSNLGAGTYNLVVSDANNCQATSTQNLVNGNGPSITSITSTDPHCGATDGTITIVASGGSAPLSYSVNNGTTTQASGSFGNLGAGTYNIVVSDANGCQVTDQEVLVSGSGPSITNVATTQPQCGASDGSIVITATSAATYSINNGATTQASGTFSNLAAGTYQVVVTDANGCQANQQVVLTTTTLPNVNAGADLTICAGESVTLTATGAATYSWTGGVQNGNSFIPPATATYTVTGTDAAGCVNTDNVTVTVIPVPTAGFTTDVSSGYAPLAVVFTNTSTNSTGYVWDFGNGSAPVTTTSAGNQTSTFSAPGIYTVQLTATNGNCSDIFTLPIVVLGNPPFEMHVPNVFTPNDDQKNDEFFIDVKNGKSITVTIFNRWGNKMFEMDDFTDRWDGKDATEGVYFFVYSITDLDGKLHEGHGHVTLVRK